MKLTEQIEFNSLRIIFDKLICFNEKHKWIDIFIAPFGVVVILLVVYATKGVYPFGLNTVSYYDMPASYIPIYTFAWDALHGLGGIYLNWYCGLAVSMADVVGNFMFFPTNLFFLFTSRDGIIYAMSFFLIAKFALCALSMSFYYKKHFGDFTGTICSGFLFSMCGFAVQYYINIFYFDLVMIFPLIVYALERLLLKHRYFMFIGFMFLAFFTNVQLVFMLGVYLVYKTYFILKNVTKEDKGKSIRLFAISVIIAAMLACFILLPSIIQTFQSSRSDLNSGFNYLDMMKSVYCSYRKQKKFIMYGSEISVGLLILVLCRGKEISKKYYENIIMISILALPILHEGINLLWHAGSYKHFPIRFGYILTFECIVFVGTYLKNERIEKIKIISRAAKLLGVALIPFIAYILFEFSNEFKAQGIADLSSYNSYWIYFVTLIIAYFIIFLIDSDITRKALIIVLVLVQVYCGCNGFIAPYTASYKELRYEYTMNGINLNKYFEKTGLDKRIKSNPAEYESNYAIEAAQPSIASWLYGMGANTEKVLCKKMGYDGVSTYVMDSGGTVFTDALLGVNYYVSSINPDCKLYKANYDIPGVWVSNYVLPFGIVFENTDVNDSSVLFEYNNFLFSSLTGLDKKKLIDFGPADDYCEEIHTISKDEIITLNKLFDMREEITSNALLESEEKDNNKSDGFEGDIKEYKINIDIDNNSSLYLVAPSDYDGCIRICVDGEPIEFNSFTTPNNYDYPNAVRTGIVALGTYNNDLVEIAIYTTESNINEITIGKLDLSLLNEGIKTLKKAQALNVNFNNSGMNIIGKTFRSGTLFLPIGYSENWHAKINGNDVQIQPFIDDAFISMEVPKGDVNIEMRYYPKGLLQGIIISISGLVTLLLLACFTKHGGIKGKTKEIMDKIFVYGYYAVVGIIFLIMYIVPIYIKMAL